jgi:hypothetical protein
MNTVSITAFVFISMILIVAVLITIMVFRQVKLYNKQDRIVETLETFAKDDEAWDYNYILRTVNDIYIDFNTAFNQKNMALIEDRISENFKKKYAKFFQSTTHNMPNNTLPLNRIVDLSIISYENFKNNNLDIFSATVSYIKDSYYLNLNRRHKEKAYVYGTNIYHFTRKGNSWLLDDFEEDIIESDYRNEIEFNEV